MLVFRKNFHLYYVNDAIKFIMKLPFFITCNVRNGHGAMAYWLRCWISNPGVPCSKPLGGSKVDSDFHLSEVDKMSTRNIWEFVVKSKLPPRSGTILEVVEPHP